MCFFIQPQKYVGIEDSQKFPAVWYQTFHDCFNLVLASIFTVVEPLIIFGFAYEAYILAEMFHFSGIIRYVEHTGLKVYLFFSKGNNFCNFQFDFLRGQSTFQMENYS